MKFTSDWFSPHITKWEKFLFPLFKGVVESKLDFLEIGCYEGRASLWLLENFPNSILTVVDTFKGCDEQNDAPEFELSKLEERFRHNIQNFVERVEVNVCKSENLVTLKTFDLVYVDGSHKACDALYDGMLGWRKLRAGGVMIFDDYEWGGWVNEPLMNPKLGIDMFLKVNEGQYTILDKAYQVTLQKL